MREKGMGGLGVLYIFSHDRGTFINKRKVLRTLGKGGRDIFQRNSIN